MQFQKMVLHPQLLLLVIVSTKFSYLFCKLDARLSKLPHRVMSYGSWCYSCIFVSYLVCDIIPLKYKLHSMYMYLGSWLRLRTLLIRGTLCLVSLLT